MRGPKPGELITTVIMLIVVTVVFIGLTIIKGVN